MGAIYGIIVGPGHHHLMMIEVFKKEKVHFRYAVYWPSLKVFEVDTDGNETLIYYSWIYASVSKLLWGMKVRFPFAFQKSFHKDLLYTLYDRLVSSFFEDCKLLIGWSQVCLYSVKKVKKNGGKFILEHPMVHAEHWNKTIFEEYERFFSGKKKRAESLWSTYMLRRMKKEYELANQINLLSSYAIRTFTDRGVAARKLHLIHLGTDLPDLKNRAVRKEKKFTVLYVGRIEVLKGVHYLINGFIKAQLPDSQLWLVGSIKDEMREFMNEHEGQYVYLGNQSKEKLAELYQAAHVVVFPSLLDAFGLVIIEALQCGTPVIATDTSGGPDVIKDNLSGELISAGSSKVIKDALINAYNNIRSHRFDSGANVSDHLFSTYNKSTYYKQIQQLLNLK